MLFVTNVTDDINTLSQEYNYMYLCTVKLFPTIDNHTSNGVLGRTASQSFTAWTRGGSQVDEESTEVTGEDGDPFSHVAGPSYRDIMKQGTSIQSSQQNTVSDNSLCLLSAGRVSLSERRRKPDKRPVNYCWQY